MQVITLDSQILNAIQLCARKTKYSFVEHLVPLVKAEPLERGDLLHELLRIYYNNKKMGNPFNMCVDEALHHGQLYSIKMSLSEEDIEETIFQFKEYCKFYRYETWEPIEVEQVFSKPLYRDDDLLVLYEGKIDLIVRASNVGKLVVDHKSSKRREEVSPMSNQFIGYAWASETHNVVVDKIGFQKTLKPEERFQRPVLSYTNEIIEEWIDNTVWWAKMILLHNSMNHWPMNLTSCDKYGGCIFESVCSRESADRDRIILKLFKVQEWKPAKSLEEEKANVR